MKCLVVAKSMDNPATRYRLAPVVQQLRDRGDAVTLIYEPGFFSQLRLITRAAGCDLIFIQRKLMNSIIVCIHCSNCSRCYRYEFQIPSMTVLLFRQNFLKDNASILS